jgi:hypothetical protein
VTKMSSKYIMLTTRTSGVLAKQKHLSPHGA